MARTASNQPTTWKPRRVRVGDWRVTDLCDGFFRLDGGSMWGVVPATFWREMTPPAEDNTILLALRPYLLERGDEKVIVEGGIGDRWPEKQMGIYHIQRTETLQATLGALGIEPGQITSVVASHCHWDHIGSLVVESAGALVPLFPRAIHYMPRIEVEMAKNADHARRASYREDDVAAIEERGLLRTYEGDTELLEGVRAKVVGGHSDGVSVISVNEEGSGETAVFWADVVPTTHHIQPPYIMAYDIDVVRSFNQRSRLLEQAVEQRWIGLFYHDADESFGRISRAGRRYEFEPLGEDEFERLS